MPEDPDDDAMARKRRAEALREEIRRRTQPSTPDAPPERPLSPREAIEKRMRELDRDKKR